MTCHCMTLSWPLRIGKVRPYTPPCSIFEDGHIQQQTKTCLDLLCKITDSSATILKSHCMFKASLVILLLSFYHEWYDKVNMTCLYLATRVWKRKYGLWPVLIGLLSVIGKSVLKRQGNV